MLDRIVFLGTGGGRVVIANQLLATGGFVIQTEGYQIWVDPGPGALVRAKQFGVLPKRTDIIYVTHHHLDHSNDLNVLIDAMTLGGIHKKGILITTPTVINGSEEDTPTLSNNSKKALKEVFAVKAGDKVKINSLTFTATPAKHDCDAVGMKLENKKITIGYTTNTAPIPELNEVYKGCDVIVADVLRPGKDKWPTHFCSEDAANLFKEAKPKLGIISHFGAKMLKANPVYEAREIAKKAGMQVFAAREGMKLDLKTLFVS